MLSEHGAVDNEVTVGEIAVESDNYSALTIMKVSLLPNWFNFCILRCIQDQITAQANYRSMQLQIDSELVDESVYHVLEQLHPLVQEQYEIAKQNQLIDGLKELQVSVSKIHLSYLLLLHFNSTDRRWSKTTSCATSTKLYCRTRTKYKRCTRSSRASSRTCGV